MPIDYSKWDALELSDDSDIEVHPNVDKRSFIRAKQNQIHMERMQRKHEIETLKYEHQVNDGLMKRIAALLDVLKNNADNVQMRNPAEVAFQAVMESAPKDPKDDLPPPRPEGVHKDEKELPSFSKMMVTVMEQVQTALNEKNVALENRYTAMIEEVEEHLKRVQGLQAELEQRLQQLETENSKKITSESYHTGFDSSHINKSKLTDKGGSSSKKNETKVELLNPNFDLESGRTKDEAAKDGGDDDDNDEETTEASPMAVKFAKISANRYQESFQFLTDHPEILTEAEQDGIMMMAFDASLTSKYDLARQYVHQSLLLQYCRALGRDGVRLFFKRIMTPEHRAQEVFFKDVHETYTRIRTRTQQIQEERRAKGGEEQVEQIQLHAMDPNSTITITVPAPGTPERVIFESFSPEMQKALELGSLDVVNKVLGDMPVSEAEELVEKFGNAGILSIEEKIVDATTDEGKQAFAQMQAQNAQAAAAEADVEDGKYVNDPE